MERLEYKELDELLYREVLPNGLRAFVLCRPGCGKQFAFLAVRYGGADLRFRDENGDWTETPPGMAHYLEHKLFDSAQGSVTQKFAENGAVDNAFTAADMTGYYFEGTFDFEENLKTLLTFVANPCFTEEDVEKERNIILQEICMEEDDPYSELYYATMEMLYGNLPAASRIAGTQESIAEIHAPQLYQCYRAFYRPGNMVLCAAGDIDPEQVFAAARECLPVGGSTPVYVDRGREDKTRTRKESTLRTMPVSVPLFTVGIKGEPAEPGKALRSRLVAELACDVLFGPSSELYNRLYDEGLINDTFGGDYEAIPGAAYLIISGESRDPERVREELLQAAERLAAQGIEPDFWDRLIRAAYGAMVRRLNSPEDTCIELAQASFDAEDYFRFPEIFQSIEAGEVQGLLSHWFKEDRTALSVIQPEEY